LASHLSWVGPRPGVDALEERKIFGPSMEQNHQAQVFHSVA